MRAFVVNVIVTAIALAILVYVLPQVSIQGDSRVIGLLVVAVVIGVVNGFIKPAVKILSFPLTVMSLGLFSLVINGLMLLLVAWIVTDLKIGVTMKIDTFPPDLSIGAVGIAILAAIVLSIVRGIVDALTPD